MFTIVDKKVWDGVVKAGEKKSQSLIEISDSFSDVIFDGCDFSGIRFMGSFENVTFKNCYFDTEFSGYSMLNCVFDPNNEIRKIVLNLSMIISSDFSELTFINFTSVGSSFHECLFINSIIKDGRIEDATIMNSDFDSCKFSLIDILNSRFSHNSMINAVFNLVYMCDVKISNGVLNNSSFKGCYLEDININYLDMFNANIIDTSFSNITFNRVVLVETLFDKLILRGNVYFDTVDYSNIVIDSTISNNYKFLFKNSYGYHNDVDFEIEYIDNRWSRRR